MSQESPNINHLWQLVDPVGIQDAAALIAGFDPSYIRYDGTKVTWVDTTYWWTDEASKWTETALTALTNAIMAGKLKAMIRRNARMQGWDEFPATGENIRDLNPDIPDVPGGIRQGFEPAVIYCETPDWGKTTVERKDLIEWLRSMGVTTGFFFPSSNQSTGPDYLNQEHPRYAPKLAAAVLAWESYSEVPGKSPKQVLSRWLNENASKFGLTDDDGKPREETIKDLAAIPNWQTTGGAPKTPI